MSPKNQGFFIHHFNAVTVDVTGSGNLQLKLWSKQELFFQELESIAMEITDKSTTKLANFKKECVKLELRISEIDETFRIGKIIIHHKPIAASYPM